MLRPNIDTDARPFFPAVFRRERSRGRGTFRGAIQLRGLLEDEFFVCTNSAL